jgi:hypothetical protein
VQAILLSFETLFISILTFVPFFFVSLLKILIGKIDRIEQLIHRFITSLPLLWVAIIAFLFEDVGDLDIF